MSSVCAQTFYLQEIYRAVPEQHWYGTETSRCRARFFVLDSVKRDLSSFFISLRPLKI